MKTISFHPPKNEFRTFKFSFLSLMEVSMMPLFYQSESVLKPNLASKVNEQSLYLTNVMNCNIKKLKINSSKKNID